MNEIVDISLPQRTKSTSASKPKVRRARPKPEPVIPGVKPPTLQPFTFMYPPSANRYWRTFRGQNVLSAEARAFRLHVAEVVAARGEAPREGRLCVHVSLFPPDGRRHDIDNRIKPLLDALQHAGVFPDDEQVDDLHITRRDKRRGGCCLVLILPYSPPMETIDEHKT